MKIDAVMILGKELRRDPERARRELKARSAAASVALRNGARFAAALEARLRGQGESGSAIVGRYLADLGADPARLILADLTRSTRDEATQGALLAKKYDLRRLGVVTASYHVPRVRAYFQSALPPDRFVVFAPENMLQRSNPREREWILAGTPSEATLEEEGRLETILTVAAKVVGAVPGGHAVEQVAARLLRRVG